MYYQYYQMPMMEGIKTLQYTTLVEPYVLETLKMIVGKSVVVETVRGNLAGMLVDVKPDHIVIRPHNNGTIFYVRLQQIVHIMPD